VEGWTDHWNSISEDHPSEHLAKLSRFADERRIFVSVSGRIGLASSAVRSGDELCVLKGCRTPLALRRRPEGTYTVIETCYLRGCMLRHKPVNWDTETGDEFVFV
jgi:hypothetical protein